MSALCQEYFPSYHGEYTFRSAAQEAREDAYQRTLAALTEAEAVEALEAVPFAALFRKGVSPADLGQIVSLALDHYVELQSATDPDEIDRLAEMDPVVDLLLELSIKRAAGAMGVQA